MRPAKAGRIVTLREALDLTRTGDVWLFSGHAPATGLSR